MPERIHRLRATLAELEQELSDLDSLDPASRQRLQEVAAEIAHVLHRSEAAYQNRSEAAYQQESATDGPGEADIDSAGIEPPHTLQEQLIKHVEAFRVQHPTVAGILQRLVHGLAGLGI